MEVLRAAQWLNQSYHPLVLTGAGVSAESGIPTFRGAGGYWRQFKAEDLATPEAFDRDPKLVWEWYNDRRTAIAGKSPNAAHKVLAAWEKRFPGFNLITQNVDGLHQTAGSRRVVPMHGNIWETRCTKENHVQENRQVPLPEIPPTCPRCGSIVRPNIVWFGEMIPSEWLFQIQALLDDCDLFIVIGTSGIVYPAAGFISQAQRRGIHIVEINPQETPMSELADLVFRVKAAEILPKIDHAIPTDR